MIYAGITYKNHCPRNEVFIKAFLRELSLEENERFIDHILVCEKCSKKFELMKQLSRELAEKMNALETEKLSPEDNRELRKLARKKIKASKSRGSLVIDMIPLKYVAAAVSLIVVAAGLYVVLKMGQGEVYRNEGRESGLVLMGPTGRVSEPPEVFVWSAYEGAEEYYFELIDDELNTLLLDNRVRRPKLILPVDIVKKLEKGRTYVWKVYAEDDDDNVLDSARTSFEIK
jgi:hypothetical protein